MSTLFPQWKTRADLGSHYVTAREQQNISEDELKSQLATAVSDLHVVACRAGYTQEGLEPHSFPAIKVMLECERVFLCMASAQEMMGISNTKNAAEWAGWLKETNLNTLEEGNDDGIPSSLKVAVLKAGDLVYIPPQMCVLMKVSGGPLTYLRCQCMAAQSHFTARATQLPH